MPLELPNVDYRPRDPGNYRPAIGLIGCGGITSYHLQAYRAAEYRVVALCDVNRAAAEGRKAEYFPEATVYSNADELLGRDDIQVVDITTHPLQRVPLIEKALLAGKHVLSQKPFVLDLDAGERLVALAEQRNRLLAVNQNGRWAPHFSYIRQAIAQGVIGAPSAAHLAVHWNHGWVAGTVFEHVEHLILYDFAVHWFDILCCFMGDQQPRSVYATVAKSVSQVIAQPLLAQVLVEYDHAQASLVFDADTQHGSLETTYVTGPLGTLSSRGVDSNRQQVTLSVGRQRRNPQLIGRWFPDGFHGTMGELLCAIEENREPTHSAKNNLRSLALCFAAVASAQQRAPVVPGSIKRLPQA